MFKTLLLGLAVAAVPTLSALAAPATPEEAARLTALFERYVGRSAAGVPGSVTVTPKGDAYVTTLDVKRALAGLESFGFIVDPWTYQALLTPLPDGTWKVVSDGGLPLVVHAGSRTISTTSANDHFEGVFDPKLKTFATIEQTVTGYDTVQTSPTGVQSRHTDRSVLTGTGKAADGGTVASAARLVLTGLRGEFLTKPAADTTTPGAGDPAVPPPTQPGTAVSYVAPAGALDISLDRLRVGNLLDLWAFLVAHPTRESLAAAQDDLKPLLRAGLPFADGVKESGSVETLSVTTPFGPLSMSSLGSGIDAAGLTGSGKAALALSIADLVVPTDPLPAWSKGLVPTGLDLHVGVDGFHATEAADAAVDAVDLKKEVIITPQQKDMVGHIFWPGGGTVTLAPSRFVTKVLDLHMEGQATMGEKPKGRVTIRGKGLDTEIGALQAQAGTDPMAGQILGPLVMAKNLSKPDPEGGLVWVIEFGDGPVKINGATLQ